MSSVDPAKNVAQLSFVGYPDGQERGLTDDLNDYRELRFE
jgi:hypothetical protein